MESRPPFTLDADSSVFAQVLSDHGIAAIVMRRGELRWANQCARQTMIDTPQSEEVEDDVADARLARALQVTGPIDDLPVGERRAVTVDLATNRALLHRDGVAVGVDDDGPAALVTFSTDALNQTDPAHLDRLETMLEATADIIAVIDGDGRVRFSNAAAGRLTGLTGLEVNGRSIVELVHADDVDRVATAFAAAVGGERIDVVEFRLRFSDGTFHPVEAEVPAEVTIDGATAYVVTVRDISDRIRRQNEKQSSRRLLEALVENIDDVIVVLGEDLSVRWASPGIEQLVDAPAYTNVGENAFNDMHPDDIVGVIDTLAAIAEEPGRRGRAEFRLEHARRGWRWLEAMVVNRLDDPDIGGLVCTLRDITEKRDLDAELQRLREQDKREVARLKEADQLKDLFLATVSHELRTPLTSVHGFSGMLESRGTDLDEATRTDLARRIHTNAGDMRRMIDQLIELSRLQAGRVELVPGRVELEDMVASVIGHLEQQLAEHEVTTQLDGLAVHADSRALEYVLRNLLTNAARYSEPGTIIDISAKRRGDTVVVRVTDQGVGISAADRVRIFGSFYQAGSTDVSRRGVGIGLNIARRYTQLLSGRLTVESELGAGSTFSVTVPASD